jgi:tRNA uridine 5-carboxymethylaminomethyl modification enzyme
MGYQLGLISKEDYTKVQRKYEMIEKEIEHLRCVKINPGTDLDKALQEKNSSPLKQSTSLYELLKRPQVSYDMIASYDGTLKDQGAQIIAQVEYEIKYEGFISRQKKDVEKFKHIEHIRIPQNLNVDEIPGLSKEIREKLKRFSPTTLGQANRISGVTPAAITLMMVYLKKLKEASQ